MNRSIFSHIKHSYHYQQILASLGPTRWKWRHRNLECSRELNSTSFQIIADFSSYLKEVMCPCYVICYAMSLFLECNGRDKFFGVVICLSQNEEFFRSIIVCYTLVTSQRRFIPSLPPFPLLPNGTKLVKCLQCFLRDISGFWRIEGKSKGVLSFFNCLFHSSCWFKMRQRFDRQNCPISFKPPQSRAINWSPCFIVSLI